MTGQKGVRLMKIIGITGGIGSGKSQVIQLMVDKYNTYNISTDKIANDLMKKGQKSYEKVVEAFGQEVLQLDGEIDRRKLASIVFKSQAKILKLNSLTHPLVREKVIQLIEQIRKEGNYNYIVVETALPYEANLKSYCDEVWGVLSSYELRKQRLKKSRGYSEEKITDILNKQLSNSEFEFYCDHIILNNGTIKELEEQLSKAVQSIS